MFVYLIRLPLFSILYIISNMMFMFGYNSMFDKYRSLLYNNTVLAFKC